ncbi:FAD-binding protein [Oleomonas cavernae]|uniref:D-lactate dehydrogenase (cytochrome) n=1 Tax=Oleomonas cavernae TaxID=2320859 RepID=A0A418W9S4_9PROT|nr:FAD-linked oxidase C-terminal domain-containing protein [Oleomonas cavernae]RJF86765.1 FAD-binding protein [Oleomonas cavernae]
MTKRAPTIEALTALFGDRISTAAAIRDQHGHGESWHPTALPDAVFFALSEDEVARAVRICADHATPIVPFGAGTSVEGQVQAVNGGISIDVSRMKRIIAVRAEDMDCTVEPGVTRVELNDYIRDLGLFFPVDPAGEATFGGMASTRASGTNAVRYGTMKDMVLSLRAVLPDGSVLRTGQRAKKSSAGYDLTRLMIGAEGTLGIITELNLKLAGIPQQVSAATCSFPDLRSAVRTVVETLQCGVAMSRIEVADEVQVKAFNLYNKTSFPEQPMLFLEFAGNPKGVAAEIEIVHDLALGNGGGDFQWANTEEERRALWRARYSAVASNKMLKPGAMGMSTDVCVPISRLVECIEATKQDLLRSSLPAPLVGHVGDGNFHLYILFDPNDPAEMREAERISEELAERAIAMEGTCTGEHGIGLGKRKFMNRELGNPAIAAMRAIKAALDPQNIMNPGKMLP